jgi:hypothetical protein
MLTSSWTSVLKPVLVTVPQVQLQPQPNLISKEPLNQDTFASTHFTAKRKGVPLLFATALAAMGIAVSTAQPSQAKQAPLSPVAPTSKAVAQAQEIWTYNIKLNSDKPPMELIDQVCNALVTSDPRNSVSPVAQYLNGQGTYNAAGNLNCPVAKQLRDAKGMSSPAIPKRLAKKPKASL